MVKEEFYALLTAQNFEEAAEFVAKETPEAIANAIDKGSAMIATINPAIKSLTNCFLE